MKTLDKLYKGKIAVITFGTFDCFHYGHMNLLQRAAMLGDHLYVFVSTDEFNSVEKNKHALYGEDDRYNHVSELRCVYKVWYENSWDDKLHYINELKREYDNVILVMGDDWTGKFDDLPCEVVYLPRTPEISSSKIKEIINDKTE